MQSLKIQSKHCILLFQLLYNSRVKAFKALQELLLSSLCLICLAAVPLTSWLLPNTTGGIRVVPHLAWNALTPHVCMAPTDSHHVTFTARASLLTLNTKAPFLQQAPILKPLYTTSCLIFLHSTHN